jgi:predicted transcriptional regulator of viral defense system
MKHKTVLLESSNLLSHFNDLNKPCFTLRDIEQLDPSKNQNSIRSLVDGMVKRGLLLRLKSGLYYLIPFDKDPQTFFPNWHTLAQYLADDYYIGYYSAMQIHSLITQPSLIEQIVVNRQMKPSVQEIKDVKFQFIYHNQEHFFGYKNIWIDNFNKVACSDLEKTFVDCLFKPDYAGGIVEIAKAIHKSKDRIDYSKLLEYVKAFNSQSVIKRLGFLLELLEIKQQLIEELRGIKTDAFTLLEPGLSKEGKMITRWSIQQNLDTDSILSPILT